MIETLALIGGLALVAGIYLGVTRLLKYLKSLTRTYIELIVLDYLKNLQK